MHATKTLRAAAGRTPLIQFLGKRSVPQSIDHSPRPHPAAPVQKLPNSFAQYRENAQQHGPLSGYRFTASPSIQPKQGEVFDRSELPPRFWRLTMTPEEMEVIEGGGAPAFA
ncbi:hypothetical protein RUND412_002084 [Rhizina undulata]